MLMSIKNELFYIMYTFSMSHKIYGEKTCGLVTFVLKSTKINVKNFTSDFFFVLSKKVDRAAEEQYCTFVLPVQRKEDET